MKRISALFLLAAALATGGCATRGPLTVECPEFRSFAKPVPVPSLVRAIQQDAKQDDDVRPSGASVLPGAEFTEEDIEAYIRSITPAAGGGDDEVGISSAGPARPFLDIPAQNLSSGDPRYPGPALLMLSGGGQWGAFGAGFWSHLAKKGEVPRFATITGVSTGALQALFLAAHQVEPQGGWLDRLNRNYAPATEKDVVKRSKQYMAIVYGSIAGLAPLRRKIELALCDTPGRANEDTDCRLVDLLAADGAPEVLIGFVEANSGEMQYVVANDIARSKLGQEDKRQCLAGAALASVAMPLQFQQIRIASTDKESGTRQEKAYFDGGVRQSVFEALSDGLVKRDLKLMSRAAGRAVEGDPERTIYVVRNGPTTAPAAKAGKSPDDKADALTAAWRGYALIVNQTEVMSVAWVRPQHRTAEILLTTADGFGSRHTDPGSESEGIGAGQREGCEKAEEDAMFEPEFMKCLRGFGRAKAENRPWIVLPEKE